MFLLLTCWDSNSKEDVKTIRDAVQLTKRTFNRQQNNYYNPLVCKISVVIRSGPLLFFLPIGLSNFTDIKKMPLSLKKDPEKLWQLDERSLIPDEVEIFVPGGLPFKADIRPRGDLDTPFTKDNIIEVNPMLFIAYVKKIRFKGNYV